MKRKDKINKLGPIRSSRHLNDNWLGKFCFGKDEEPRVKGKEKGKV